MRGTEMVAMRQVIPVDAFDYPWRLQPDNFTPPTRTPWGGEKILGLYKQGLAIAPDKRGYSCVGESWEVSVDAQFASTLVDHSGETLSAAIAQDFHRALGAAAARGGLSVLLKLLDARQALSVQVHPRDDYAGLKPLQSGKPESWFVLEAEAGAGLYLGFADGVSKQQILATLAQGASLAPLMNFVPVASGDVFEIDAGTVHAIGSGVTLVEPQAVQPGKEGVTYRLWDWGRRYDANGVESPAGNPRVLHVEQALAVSNFEVQGRAFVERVRKRGTPLAAGGPSHTRYIDNPAFVADWIKGAGAWTYVAPSARACVVVEGRVRYQAGVRQGEFRKGEAFFIPFAAGNTQWTLHDASVVSVEPR